MHFGFIFPCKFIISFFSYRFPVWKGSVYECKQNFAYETPVAEPNPVNFESY